ncbi:hypothetical protein [Roseicyclus persicicus]|uniref:Uncharacterized protein n=1 Tax=Roseicyclus persicicus TaxID=2650661 RepID=A0A7X6GZE0_9RHOB|nr:hypothetical protein [Roseibacterium persicicum]NKX44363.1 hypothetical protein [Roseibacterium persicicum]
MVLRHALALALLLLPALPAAAQGGGALQVTETGVSGVYTAQVRVSAHPHHVIMGHVLIVTRDGETVRALVLRHRDDGVHRLSYAEAWAGGTRLPFRREAGLGCTHGHCRDRALGMVYLSAALFDRAVVAGLAFRLVERSGTLDIAAPASLFRDATARAAR